MAQDGHLIRENGEQFAVMFGLYKVKQILKDSTQEVKYMNTLSRWDPFQDMYDMRRALNQLMQQPYWGSEGQQSGFEMDVCEDEDAYEVEASLPGVDSEDVEVTWNNNILTIRGETRSDEDQGEKNYHLRERRYGTFVRSISLPGNIDEDAIEANFNNGLLTLRLPKSEEEKTKRIRVNSGKRLESGKSTKSAKSTTSAKSTSKKQTSQMK
jgi:HSP20 family protein